MEPNSSASHYQCLLFLIQDWVYTLLPLQEIKTMTFNITPVFFNIGINEQVPSKKHFHFSSKYIKKQCRQPWPTGWAWMGPRRRTIQTTPRYLQTTFEGTTKKQKKIPKEVKENPAEHFYERYRKGGFFERAAERVGRNGRQMVGPVRVNNMFWYLKLAIARK